MDNFKKDTLKELKKKESELLQKIVDGTAEPGTDKQLVDINKEIIRIRQMT